MKRILIFLVLVGLAYGGYLYYQQSRTTTNISNVTVPSELEVKQVGSGIGDMAAVLGASISNLVSTGQEYLSGVTNGASEPVINQLITKTQEALKDLPKREAEKIKYEFCKDVVTEFENKSVVKETP